MRHFLSILFAASLSLTVLSRAAEPVSVLSTQPDWSDLTPFQKTITRADFLHLLDTVYAPGGAWKEAIDIGRTSARIHQPGAWGSDFRLEFAPSPEAALPAPRYWTPPGARKTVPGKPLAGYTIALDPGHLGGRWARMEERWFKIGDAQPVMEGEMVWLTAQHLTQRLKDMGANVVQVRKQGEPVTSERPRTLRRAAKT